MRPESEERHKRKHDTVGYELALPFAEKRKENLKFKLCIAGFQVLCCILYLLLYHSVQLMIDIAFISSIYYKEPLEVFD